MTKIHRRGQLSGESLALTATTAVVIFLLVAFFIIIRAPMSSKTDAELSRMSLPAMEPLQAYLKTPVQISHNGENITLAMSELIRLSKYNEQYKPVLESESQEIFREAYGSRYHFSISYHNSEFLDIGKSLLTTGKIENIQMESFTMQTISIPDFEITLYLFEK